MTSQILRIKRKHHEEPLQALKVGKRRKLNDKNINDSDECVLRLLTSLQEKDNDVTIKLSKAIKRKDTKIEDRNNCLLKKKQKSDLSFENLSVGVLHGEADNKKCHINWNNFKQTENEDKMTCNGVEMKRENIKNEYVYDYYTVDKSVTQKIDLTEFAYVRHYELVFNIVL